MDKTNQPHAIETYRYETWESKNKIAPTGEGHPYTNKITP
ncbi:hypothetical protein, partial [Pseudomonas aeruginosa]